MSNAPAIAFRTGGNAAESAQDEASKIAASRRNSGPEYFGLKEDGDQMVLRLLTDDDEVIWVDQHSFVPTKAAPKDSENFPKTMTAVCRKDQAFAGVYKDCYICDKKIKNDFKKISYPQIRVWALAIEREIVRGDGTEALGGPAMKDVVVGIRDKITEIEELDTEGKATGVTLRFPKIIIINQPVKTFWGHFRQMYGLYGTLTDRDYIVTRKGKGTDTEYQVASIDPIPDVKPNTPAWERYLQALTDRKIDLGQIVAEKASDVYYARFFNPALDVDKDGNVTPAGTAPTGTVGMVNLPADHAAAPTGASLGSDLREKIRNMGKPVETAPEDSTPSEEPPY